MGCFFCWWGLSLKASNNIPRLVRERTSIPVPRVLKSFKQPEPEISVIFMEYVDDDPLDQAWDTFNQDQKQHIIGQLRCYLDELRQIKGEFIGSVDGSVCCDQIFANRAHDYGPYESEEMFRSGIIESLRACDANPAWTEVVAGFIGAMPKHDQVVLTRGDLVPGNILVKDGLVFGIVDWEMAGFFPLYWEYTKAHFFCRLRTLLDGGKSIGSNTGPVSDRAGIIYIIIQQRDLLSLT
ncbi:putative Aminoglycoside phosphotransferase domain-containing protein [Seiridium cardinale]